MCPWIIGREWFSGETQQTGSRAYPVVGIAGRFSQGGPLGLRRCSEPQQTSFLFFWFALLSIPFLSRPLCSAPQCMPPVRSPPRVANHNDDVARVPHLFAHYSEATCIRSMGSVELSQDRISTCRLLSPKCCQANCPRKNEFQIKMCAGDRREDQRRFSSGKRERFFSPSPPGLP